MLKIKKPIVVIDIESTGLNVSNDRIISIGLVKLHPNNHVDHKLFLINPEYPICEEASKVHGFTEADVVNFKPFGEYLEEIVQFIDNCDIAGFNSNKFDAPLLNNEFLRNGYLWDYSNINFIDVGNLYKIKEPRTLESAVRYYLNKEHIGSHSALQDAIATMEVLLSQLNKYEDLPDSIENLAKFSNFEKPILDLSGKFTTNHNGDIVFNFGPHKDKNVLNHTDFLHWMYYKADFPADTNKLISKILSNYSEEVF